MAHHQIYRAGAQRVPEGRAWLRLKGEMGSWRLAIPSWSSRRVGWQLALSLARGMGRVLLRARDAGGVQRRTVFFKPGTVSSVFSLVQVLQVRNAVIFRKSLREQAFMPAVEVGLHDRIEPTTLLKGLRLAGNTALLASAGVAFRPPSHLPDAEQLAV